MLARYLPILSWGKSYSRDDLLADSLAAVVVTIMLIPQSLAYALLAGLPAEMGLYASIMPLAIYALFGSSRTLSVGPVAVASLMTASAVGSIAQSGTADYATAAVVLAMLSGLMLVVLGLLRFGFMANFLSHPVVSGFITAAGIIIICSQLRHILGTGAGGDTLPALLAALGASMTDASGPTLATGVGVMLFLFWARSRLSPVLQSAGFNAQVASTLAKAAPAVAIGVTIVVSFHAQLMERGVALVGEVPQGLPSFSTPFFSLALWQQLALPALLISLIGFVESVSVGRTLAAKRKQQIDANQELLALGAANIASSVSAGFPVTGGFARSIVNFDAGARTQAASILAAAGIALAALFLTPILYYLPKATLAATIIVAVISLLDFKILSVAWQYSRSDFFAVVTTIVATLILGVELGVLTGVIASIGLHFHKSVRPHMAVVGAMPGTEHYRNVERHEVITYPNIVSIRIDESLYFANASYLENSIYKLVADQPALEHVILQCTAVNEIDLSALEALETINYRLHELALSLHLSEVKGPVMDALKKTDFLEHLSGEVYLSHHQAVERLKPDVPEPYII